MALDFLCILFVDLHDEPAHSIAFCDALLQFATDEGQLKVEIVGMAGFQIVQEGWHADLLVVLEIGMIVDGEVNHRQKGVGIDSIQSAGLADGHVAKSEIDAKGA